MAYFKGMIWELEKLEKMEKRAGLQMSYMRGPKNLLTMTRAKKLRIRRPSCKRVIMFPRTSLGPA